MVTYLYHIHVLVRISSTQNLRKMSCQTKSVRRRLVLSKWPLIPLILMVVPLPVNWNAKTSYQLFTTKEGPFPMFLILTNLNMQPEFHENSLKSCKNILKLHIFGPK